MRSRRASAFTLIELMAATLIGSLLVTSAMGVFSALNRANTRFAVRYDHTTDMEKTYVAVQHAMRGLVVVPLPSPDEAPARLSLQHVPGPVKMRSPGWASSRVLVIGDERDQPQRLEVVVDKAPLPSLAAQRLTRLGVAALGLDPEEISLAYPVAERGAFVLRPVAMEGRTPLWQLVWQPMIPLKPIDGPAYFAPAPPEMDIILADDIVWCRWQIFYDSERLLTHTATTVLDLPSYIELELELTSGMMANWMFEIAWTEGAELEIPLDPIAGETGGEPGGAVGESRSGETVTSPSGTFNRSSPTEGGGVDR